MSRFRVAGPLRLSTARLLTLAVASVSGLQPAGGEPLEIQPPPVTVSLSNGGILERAGIQPGPTPDTLRVLGPGAPAEPVGIRDLLALDFNRTGFSAGTPSVRFTNGDEVVGQVSFPAGRQVRVDTGWGVISAPLTWCTGLRLREGASFPAESDRDLVFLERDRVTGSIQSVAGGKIRLDLSGTPVEVPLEKVVALAPGKARAAVADPGIAQALRVVLDLGGGERVSGRWQGLADEQVRLLLDWGAPVSIPLASIQRLEVKNGRVVYLSDMKPTEVKEVPYLDGTHPYRMDRAVSGRPLRLAGKAYKRGIGVHSRSELTFALDGGFETLAAVLGLDEAVGEQGSVIFRVIGNEKVLYESPIVRGGMAAVPIRVPVRGVLLLRLEVDFADGGDAADHANWADARLLRP